MCLGGIIAAIYIVLALVNGVYGTVMHSILFPEHSSIAKLLLVFYINAFFWPIAFPLGQWDLYKRRNGNKANR
jgi:hypothetical protein